MQYLKDTSLENQPLKATAGNGLIDADQREDKLLSMLMDIAIERLIERQQSK